MNDIYLEDKHADIKATRGDNDFYYAWRCNDKVVSVEYTPMNWPAVTVLIADKKAFDFKEQVTTLKEMGYKIEEEQEVERSKKPIEVDNDLLRDRLKFALDREPKERELKAFREYVEIDIQQWIADNAKAFVRR